MERIFDGDKRVWCRRNTTERWKAPNQKIRRESLVGSRRLGEKYLVGFVGDGIPTSRQNSPRRWNHLRSRLDHLDPFSGRRTHDHFGTVLVDGNGVGLADATETILLHRLTTAHIEADNFISFSERYPS